MAAGYGNDLRDGCFPGRYPKTRTIRTRKRYPNCTENNENSLTTAEICLGIKSRFGTWRALGPEAARLACVTWSCLMLPGLAVFLSLA